jgi:hypothetical protein
MTRRTKTAALAGECQEVFVAAVFAFHTDKAVVQIATIEIAIDYLLDIGSPESVLSTISRGRTGRRALQAVRHTVVTFTETRRFWWDSLRHDGNIQFEFLIVLSAQ